MEREGEGKKMLYMVWLMRLILVQIFPGNNILLATIEGTNPELKSVLLNSHYDVVPVFPVSSVVICYI